MLYCLPVEVKARELDSRLLLAFELLKNNNACVIGRKSGVKQYMFNCNKIYVFIDKSMNKRSNTLFKEIKNNGSYIGIIDEEGGIYRKDFEKSLELKNKDESLKYVDIYFSWGEIQKYFITKNNKSINHNNIFVTGNPRFDLCKKELSNYHRLFKKAPKKYDNGYFLVTTKFGVINGILNKEDRIANIIKRRGISDYNKIIKAEYESMYDYQERVFKLFIQAINEISNKYKKDIVIRPHPAERIETYREIFEKSGNVHTIKDGSVHEWIADADLVIHHDCTTGIEAMLFQKPTISYCPILDEDLVQWLPVMSCFRINSLDELLATIDEHIINNYNPNYFINNYNIQAIKKFIANIDFSSTKKIVAVLNEKMNEWDCHTSDDVVEYMPKGRVINCLLKQAKKMLLNPVSNNKSKMTKYFENKFDKLTYDEVRDRLDALKKIESVDIEIKITFVDKDTYLLTKV